jgi:hypothetical protein
LLIVTTSCSKIVICPVTFKIRISTFTEHYNHRLYRESLNTLAPTNVYFGGSQTILLQRNASTGRASKSDACFTAKKPLNFIPINEPKPPLIQAAGRRHSFDD